MPKIRDSLATNIVRLLSICITWKNEQVRAISMGDTSTQSETAAQSKNFLPLVCVAKELEMLTTGYYWFPHQCSQKQKHRFDHCYWWWVPDILPGVVRVSCAKIVKVFVSKRDEIWSIRTCTCVHQCTRHIHFTLPPFLI